jgi:hypothetical protein
MYVSSRYSSKWGGGVHIKCVYGLEGVGRGHILRPLFYKGGHYTPSYTYCIHARYFMTLMSSKREIDRGFKAGCRGCRGLAKDIR